MNYSLRWCAHSLAPCLALLLAACSSKNGGQEQNNAQDSGGGGGGGGDGAVSAGDGGACPVQTQVTMATKLTLQTSWPSALAINAGSNQPYYIWLLSTYSIDSSNNVTGTAKTCLGLQPPIVLNSIGEVAVGAPAGSMPNVQIVIPPKTWTLPSMQVATVKGTIGGWNVGSSFNLKPSVTLNGLKPSSMWADPTATWPQPSASTAVINASDTQDDDMDGKPGVTGFPRELLTGTLPGPTQDNSKFYPAHTGSTADTPATDALYLVLRTEVALDGASTSCTAIKGNATVSLLNNHVIGCHIPADAGGGSYTDSGTDCDPAGYEFIDSNTTIYMVTSGTFSSVQLSTDGGGSCDDVLAATYP